MVNENALHNTLIILADATRAHADAISEVLIEIAAIRETVRALDPAFSEVLQEHRRANRADPEWRQAYAASLRRLDELSRGLLDGYVC
jgi:hypothetical protein